MMDVRGLKAVGLCVCIVVGLALGTAHVGTNRGCDGEEGPVG